MRPHKEKCGCWCTDSHWTKQCEAHAAETKEVRERWAADLAARRASSEQLETGEPT